jgi:ubiquinone/menaquinone biosynthesis C-methylase UbiE
LNSTTPARAADALPFINPETKNSLVLRGDALHDSVTGERVASIRDGIPRFVPAQDDYAQNFGWQWQKWHSNLSDARTGSSEKHKLLVERTRFDQFETRGKTLLECGMGGGDDTEVLLKFPFSEVHSFDLSNAVDRAGRFLSDPRLTLSQADIFRIPYADASFDFVFCHRVIQHTPDPLRALQSVCRKVKRGGVLFVHSYHRSWFFMSGYKYRYRWLTRRLPSRVVADFLDRAGPHLHRLNEVLHRQRHPVGLLAQAVVPFEWLSGYPAESREALIEISKLVTFDALMPRYDLPLSWKQMKRTVEAEGFTIKHAMTKATSPLWCTAVRDRL